MRTRTESPKKALSKKAHKPVANWMQLDIAPLIAERMYSKKPFPGTGR